MRVLITGSSGRIGRAVYVRLSRDHEVIGLDRSPSSTATIRGDFTDPAVAARALRGVDALIHTGALHAPHVGVFSDRDFELINVEGTKQLIALAVKSGVSKVVFTSTTALYGSASTPPGAAGWVTEETQPQPRSIYHRTKIAAEESLRETAQRERISITILRMSRCFPESAPMMAVYRLHRGVDARDVAAAHAAALADHREGCKTYIISGATPFMPTHVERLWSDAPSVLRQVAPDLVSAFKARGWDLPASIDRVYSSALAQRDLGWTPRFGFDEVLRMLDEESSEVLPPGRGKEGEE